MASPLWRCNSCTTFHAAPKQPCMKHKKQRIPPRRHPGAPAKEPMLTAVEPPGRLRCRSIPPHLHRIIRWNHHGVFQRISPEQKKNTFVQEQQPANDKTLPQCKRAPDGPDSPARKRGSTQSGTEGEDMLRRGTVMGHRETKGNEKRTASETPRGWSTCRAGVEAVCPGECPLARRPTAASVAVGETFGATDAPCIKWDYDE